MLIQVNTDHNVEGHGDLVRYIETEVGAALSRFDDHVTRVEVHLSDENAGKSGGSDKRCVLEARPAGRQPVAVTHRGATVDEACSGAIQKIKHLLDSEFGKVVDHKGTATIRGNKRH